MQPRTAFTGQFHGSYDTGALGFSQNKAAQLELHRIAMVVFEDSVLIRGTGAGGRNVSNAANRRIQ